METVTYDSDFFLEEGRVAEESAAVVIPWLFDHHLFNVARFSVIDVGSGTGEWGGACAGWVNTVLGVDLYAPEDMSPIALLRLDISQGVNCEGWDLAICLEVAEHLPYESGPLLVAGLAKAGTVLWSAATPGQPGVGHQNCQPPEYWEALFNEHGMTGEYIGHNFSEPVASFYVRNLWLFRRES